MKGRLLLDCSILLPGPLLGKYCAEQGARVLKIESTNRPDPARVFGSGATYRDLNQNKERVELDLTSSRDRPSFEALVKQADGLIEGYRPSTKKKLGLETATLLALNPRLVIASIVGFPEDGPRADSPGHDLSFLAATGVLSLYNELPPIPLSDTLAAYEGALSLSARLDAVSRGLEQGGRITISVFDVLQKLQSKQVAEFRETGRLPQYGQTFVTGATPCYRIYSAKCGTRIAVAAMEPKYWDSFCETIGLTQLKGQGLLTGVAGEKVAEAVANTLAQQPWEYWAGPLFAADCCVEPVLDYSALF
jgi:alpha-methylacyl-CoA racemase